MTAYRVQLAELSDLIDQMSRFTQRLEGAVDEADTTVNRLHATWSGAAAAEQRGAHERWRAATTEMNAALGTLRGIADTAHGNYTEAASANLRMWSLL